jgi:small subunit ribosomal protein S6
MYILKVLDEEKAKDAKMMVSEILTTNGATVSETKELGVKQLAYPIQKETRGEYVVLKVEADKNALDEFSRLTRMNKDVLRSMVLKDA